MKKRIRLSIIISVCCIIAIFLIILPNYMKEIRQVDDFSYINIWNEDTHYWGYGIIIEDGVLCDKLNIYFKEPLIEDVPIHIFYSKGSGLSEEESLWTTLKQGKMSQCIDLPNGEYVELRLDIAGDFSISKVVIEQYVKHKKIYYITAVIFLSICFIFAVRLILVDDKLKLLAANNFSAVLIFLIIGIIVFSYSVNVWYEIEDKTVSSYHLETRYNTQELRQTDDKYSFNIDIHDSDLVWFELWADILDGNGMLKWKLIQDQNVISTGQLSAENYYQGKYKVVLSVDTIEKAGMYQLEIEPLDTSVIQIYVDSNNYLKATYFYLFQYEMVLKGILIITDLLIMLVVIFLLSKLNLYAKFWIVAVSTGILSIIVVIPLSTADEFRHFARAYSVANGQFICQYSEQNEPYAYIPESLYNLRYIAPDNSIDVSNETNTSINMSRWLYYLKCNDSNNTVSAWMGGVSYKGIFEYLPQVIAMWIGRCLGIKQVWLFYFARVGNWIAIAAIWYAAIKITSKHKILFLVLYCMPTNIVYACTSSTDGLLNALIMLIVALAIRRYYDNNEFNLKYLVSIIPIVTYIAIIKLPYILITFSFVALDMDTQNLKNNWKRIIKKVAVITGVCITGYLISVFLKGLYKPDINITGGGKADYIRYALEHIVEVVHIFIQAFMGILDETYRQAIFINSFYISILVLPYSALMVYSGTIEKNEKILNTIQTVIMVSICLLLWGCILIAAYFWTEIGSTYIWGIQGRYICSIIMTGAIVLALRHHNFNNKKVDGRYVAAYCMVIMTVAFLKIVQMQWV